MNILPFLSCVWPFNPYFELTIMDLIYIALLLILIFSVPIMLMGTMILGATLFHATAYAMLSLMHARMAEVDKGGYKIHLVENSKPTTI